MTTLPPGKYYIGDPCYIFDAETWTRICDTFINGEIVEIDGVKCWSHGTMHGDGEFQDQNGNTFGIDSGMFAAVPIELINNPAGEDDGAIIDAPSGLTVEYDQGTFWFGSVCITTDDGMEFDPPACDFDGGYDGDLDSEFL
jgi:hypothetical protein